MFVVYKEQEEKEFRMKSKTMFSSRSVFTDKLLVKTFSRRKMKICVYHRKELERDEIFSLIRAHKKLSLCI